MLVRMAQKNYSKSRALRAWAGPRSAVIFKPWYPTLIRCLGILIWSWIAVFDYLLLTGWLH
jgi:hypothetical protein